MPEKFIWRVGIALHCLPPIFISPTIFYKHYKETQSGRRYNLTTWWFWPLNVINCILQVVENGALLTLTYVSSTDNLGKVQFSPDTYFYRSYPGWCVCVWGGGGGGGGGHTHIQIYGLYRNVPRDRPLFLVFFLNRSARFVYVYIP